MCTFIQLMKWKIFGDRHLYPMTRQEVFVGILFPKEITLTSLTLRIYCFHKYERMNARQAYTYIHIHP